jgi:hypothetical protein
MRRPFLWVIASCLVVNLYLFLYHHSPTQMSPAQLIVPAKAPRVAVAADQLPHIPHMAELLPPPGPPPPSESRPAVATSSDAIESPQAALAQDDEPTGLPMLGALEAAAKQLSVRCNLLVATAIFEGSQLLRQPHHCRERNAQAARRRAQRAAPSSPPAELCHVAFVDWQSERLLKSTMTAQLARERGEAFIGCWQLLRVPAGLPYTHGEANTLLAKLLLPRLFAAPAAAASLWVDASRQLLEPSLSSADAGGDECEGGAPLACSALAAMSKSGVLLSARGLGAGKAGSGRERHVDTSLVLRRHEPGEDAASLAKAWLQGWEEVARTRTPPRHATTSSSASAAEAAASSALALAELGTSKSPWASAVDLSPSALPPVSAASLPQEHL